MKVSVLMNLIVCCGCCIFFVSNYAYGAEGKTKVLRRMDMPERVVNALRIQDASGQWPEGELSFSEMLADSSEDVRREVCVAAINHLKKGTAGSVSSRKKLVDNLAEALTDPSPVVRDSVAKGLSTLKPEDFGPDAKMSIEKAFNIKPSKQLILLNGIADVDAVNKTVEMLIFHPSIAPSVGRFYGTLEWGAELVRARKGEKNAIKNVLQAVEEERDMVTRVTLLLQELEYVRQPEIIIFLKKYLDSDDRVEAVKSTVLGLKYAQYAAVVLAQSVEGFPVVKEDLNYTEDELDICRKWMSAQTNWVFK